MDFEMNILLKLFLMYFYLFLFDKKDVQEKFYLYPIYFYCYSLKTLYKIYKLNKQTLPISSVAKVTAS